MKSRRAGKKSTPKLKTKKTLAVSKSTDGSGQKKSELKISYTVLKAAPEMRVTRSAIKGDQNESKKSPLNMTPKSKGKSSEKKVSVKKRVQKFELKKGQRKGNELTIRTLREMEKKEETPSKASREATH
eukprot:CAMPEP_0170555592 /NCGR_PEP_ID=MMETSP0211-20121228/13485_1 /TAXON_ID=311385 /ORGANISM="Pseudokeronopsis sp., Strain OXSARD2" /LENGTH=128 /DNA_ID=CAMNT_0010865533 /DNA_START=467 /DNA_END=849 /DNA_ORIENTATION=-